jgi:hypothetical protein
LEKTFPKTCSQNIPTYIINDMIGAKICEEILVLGFLKEAQKAVENV